MTEIDRYKEQTQNNPINDHNCILEEEFNEFCCLEEYQNQWQQENTYNELGGYQNMNEYEEQWQPEYAGGQQGSTCNEQGYS